MKTLEDKIKRVVAETVEIVEYNPDWTNLFIQEKEHLLKDLSNGLIINIQHFGFTVIPNLCAKLIIDMVI